MALNTTPGADCESLCTVADADDYHAARRNSGAWLVLDQSQKETLLREAYDWLVGEYMLRWPEGQEFGADVDGTVPRLVRNASAQLAVYAIDAPLDAPPSTAPQIIEDTIGPMTTKYAEQAAPARRSFPDVARMMAPYVQAARSLTISMRRA